MDYNTQRKRLPMPEYGRSIQKMVDYAVSLPDRDERQRCAQTIIHVMKNMFPQWRDVPDFNRKLWDHLAIMADYKLDIDYPFEIQKKDEIAGKPQTIPYRHSVIRYRHYGLLLEQLLAKLADYPEGPARDRLTRMLANRMKRSLMQWNPNSLEDHKILQDLLEYTHGKVKADESIFSVQVQNNYPNNRNNHPNNKNNKNNRNRNKNNNRNRNNRNSQSINRKKY